MKVVPLCLPESLKQAELSERDILLSLHSASNIPRLLDYFEEGDNAYILIEQQKGQSLREFLRGIKYNYLFEVEV